MVSKTRFLVLWVAVCLFGGVWCTAAANAQNLFEFLGPKYDNTVKYSPKYHIPYRDNGFSQPLNRGTRKATRMGASPEIVNEIRIFPGSPDAIGQWVDQAWDEAVASFTKCGGRLASFAASLSPASLSGGISIESSIWYEPALKLYLAGGYYPSTRSVRVVNIYYGSTGDYRHARLLLQWEIKNHFGYLAGLKSEPTTPDWPCNAR